MPHARPKSVRRTEQRATRAYGRGGYRAQRRVVRGYTGSAGHSLQGYRGGSRKAGKPRRIRVVKDRQTGRVLYSGTSRSAARKASHKLAVKNRHRRHVARMERRRNSRKAFLRNFSSLSDSSKSAFPGVRAKASGSGGHTDLLKGMGRPKDIAQWSPRELRTEALRGGGASKQSYTRRLRGAERQARSTKISTEREIDAKQGIGTYRHPKLDKYSPLQLRTIVRGEREARGERYKAAFDRGAGAGDLRELDNQHLKEIARQPKEVRGAIARDIKRNPMNFRGGWAGGATQAPIARTLSPTQKVVQGIGPIGQAIVGGQEYHAEIARSGKALAESLNPFSSDFWDEDRWKNDAKFLRDVVTGAAGAGAALVGGTIETLKKPSTADENIGKLVSGGVSLITNAPKSVIKDYKQRYGEAWRGGKGWEERQRRAAERAGHLPYLFDAAGVVAVGGKAAGLGMRALPATGPTAGLRRMVERPRARMIQGGKATRGQTDETTKMAPNPIRIATQEMRDRSRYKRQKRRVEREQTRRERYADETGELHTGTLRTTDTLPEEGLTKQGVQYVERHGGKVHRNRRGSRQGQIDRIEFDNKDLGKVKGEGKLSTTTMPTGQGARIHKFLVDEGYTPRTASGKTVYYAPREVTHRTRLFEKTETGRAGAYRRGLHLNESREARSGVQREGGKILSKLSRKQKKAIFYAVESTIDAADPETARRQIGEMREYIERHDNPSQRELKMLDYLDRHADDIYTPKFREVTEELVAFTKKHEIGVKDIGFKEGGRMLAAAQGPSAELAGDARRQVDVDPFDPEASAKSISRHRRREGREEPLTRGEELDHNLALQRLRKAQDAGDEAGVRAARAELAAGGRERIMRSTSAEKRLNPEQRRAIVDMKDDEGGTFRAEVQTTRALERDEGAPAQARRLREWRLATGRSAPGYTPHAKATDLRNFVHTLGNRAPDMPKNRTYSLMRAGARDTHAAKIIEGALLNVKAVHATRAVSDIVGRFANPATEGKTIKELVRWADETGVDLNNYDVFYTGLYRNKVNNEVIGARGTKAQEVFDELQAIDDGVTEMLRVGLDDALKPASDLRSKLNSKEKLQPVLIPKEIGTELRNTASNKVGRIYDRLKSIQSRMLLGTFNVPWLVADAATNTAMTILLGGNSFIVPYARYRLWVRQLTPEQRRDFHALIDAGDNRMGTQLGHLGAKGGRWAQAWRGLRSHPITSKTPIKSSIDWFMRRNRDIANNPQRQALAYKMLRNRAFTELDNNLGRMNGFMRRFSKLASLDPEGQIRHLMKNPADMEGVARGVNEILGDWNTMTQFERQFLNRFTMFYPYLRYSTRLMLWTLPMHHPLRLAILSSMAHMSAEEQRDLIGEQFEKTFHRKLTDEEMEQMWFQMLGRYYSLDEKGHLVEFDIRNMNPFGNVITESEDSASLLSVFPPIFQMFGDQLLKGKTTLGGQKWNVSGFYTGFGEDPLVFESGTFAQKMKVRTKVAVNSLLNLGFPTREVSRYLKPGTHGDDSLPFPGMQMPLQKSDAKTKPAREGRRNAQRKLDIDKKQRENHWEYIADRALRAFRRTDSTILYKLEGAQKRKKKSNERWKRGPGKSKPRKPKHSGGSSLKGFGGSGSGGFSGF